MTLRLYRAAIIYDKKRHGEEEDDTASGSVETKIPEWYRESEIDANNIGRKRT